MKYVIPFFVPLVLINLTGIARAQQGPDATAQARAIAPLIDELTIAVVHVDLARIQAQPLLQKVAAWLPELKSELNTMAPAVAAPLESLKAAGASDAYVIVSLAGPLDPENFLLFAVPLADRADERVITKVMRQLLPDDAFRVERVNDTLVSGTSDTLARLRDITPDERPELAAAFKAVGGTAAQAVLLPPKHTRRVVDEIMPELPDTIGGGPSSILTNGIQWAAVGVDLLPKATVSAVVESRDSDSANTLLLKWGDVRRRLTEDENIRREVPHFASVSDHLTPAARDNRLILQIDERSEAFAAVLKAIRAELAD